MVYSFDVFDTCLLRICGSPANTFEVLSYRVARMLKPEGEVDEYYRKTFVALRSTYHDKLEDTYAKINKIFPLPCSVQEMVRLEMGVEEEMLRPILATKELVDSLRKKGGRIIYVSDMYLPNIFIKEQLAKYGFFQEGDGVYVSDELGAWKSDGSLFRYIQDREGLSYREWRHYGDNYVSDFKVPKRLGIKAHWLHYDYLPYEQEWRGKTVVASCQYPSILAGICRAVRLSSPALKMQCDFVSNISAPLMLFWVHHVLSDAQNRGIKRLYFCARDMHSYYLIARKLSAKFPQLEVKYLFVSRASLYNDSPWRIEYLEQEGVASKEKVALVDAVSTGRTFHFVNGLLKENGYAPVSRFYCIDSFYKLEELSGDEVEIKEIENSDYLFFDPYGSAIANTQLRRIHGVRIFFELVFSLNFHCRANGYAKVGEKIRPLLVNEDPFDSFLFDIADCRSMKKHNDRLLDCFAEAVLLTRLDQFGEEVLECIAVPSFLRFLERPQPLYLRYLHSFRYWNMPLVDKVWKKSVWKRGSTAYTIPPGWLNKLLRLKQNNTIQRLLRLVR